MKRRLFIVAELEDKMEILLDSEFQAKMSKKGQKTLNKLLENAKDLIINELNDMKGRE